MLYLNIVMSNIFHIPNTANGNWKTKYFPCFCHSRRRASVNVKCFCRKNVSRRARRKQKIFPVSFPSVIPVSRLYVKYFLSQKYLFPFSREYFPSKKYSSDCMYNIFCRKNISRLKNIWRGIDVRVIVNFCEQQQQSMLSVISDSDKVTTVSMNEILDRLLTWGMKCRKIICGGSKKK